MWAGLSSHMRGCVRVEFSSGAYRSSFVGDLSRALQASADTETVVNARWKLLHLCAFWRIPMRYAFAAAWGMDEREVRTYIQQLQESVRRDDAICWAMVDASAPLHSAFAFHPDTETSVRDRYDSLPYGLLKHRHVRDLRRRVQTKLRLAKWRALVASRGIVIYWLKVSSENACAENGAARRRDRVAFESDFADWITTTTL